LVSRSLVMTSRHAPHHAYRHALECTGTDWVKQSTQQLLDIIFKEQWQTEWPDHKAG